MKKEKVEQGETNTGCKLPSTKQAQDQEQRRHLFVDGIMEVDLPTRWKGLTMSQYNGTTDLEEHVDLFTTQAGLYTSDDAILCHVFPTSLKGPMLN